MTGPRLLRSSLTTVFMLASACQSSTGGPLEPLPSAGVEIGRDRVALVRNGALSARVTARWSSTGENSMRINYRNAGRVPQNVAVDALQMTHSTGDAALRTAVDATGVDLADVRTDNDRPRVLFAMENGESPSSKLELPPGASKDIDTELTSFSNGGAVRTGEEVTATIPMGSRAIAVTFVTRRP